MNIIKFFPPIFTLDPTTFTSVLRIFKQFAKLFFPKRPRVCKPNSSFFSPQLKSPTAFYINSPSAVHECKTPRAVENFSCNHFSPDPFLPFSFLFFRYIMCAYTRVHLCVCVCVFVHARQNFNVPLSRLFLSVLYGKEVAIRDTMNQFNSLYSRIIYPFSALYVRFYGYVGHEKI